MNNANNASNVRLAPEPITRRSLLQTGALAGGSLLLARPTLAQPAQPPKTPPVGQPDKTTDFTEDGRGDWTWPVE